MEGVPGARLDVYRLGTLVPGSSDFAVGWHEGLWVVHLSQRYDPKSAKFEVHDTSVPSLEHIESGTG